MIETLKEPGLYQLAAERAVAEITPMAMGETLRDFMVRVGVRCIERFEDEVDRMNAVPHEPVRTSALPGSDISPQG